MPNIKSYDAPALDIRPTEIGVEAAASAARRGGAFFNQAAQDIQSTGERFGKDIRDVGAAVDQYETHQQVSHGAATFVQMHSNLTDRWNDIVKNADPNDPSVAAKFNETVLAPALDDFKDAFTTEGSQKWAESHVDQLRNHFFEKTSADMSSLAGQAVKVNIAEVGSQLSNTARKDPTSTQFALDTVDSTIDGIVSSSPNVNGVEAARIKTEVAETIKRGIVKAGALGTIENAADPEKAATSFADRYGKYINGDEVGQLALAAKVAKQAQRVDQMNAARQQDKQDDIKASGRLDDILKDANGDNPQITARDVIKDASFDGRPEDRQRALNIIKPKEEVPAATANKNMVDLLKRINADDGDPRKITDKRQLLDELGKTVNYPQYEHLLNEFKFSKTTEGPGYAAAMDYAKKEITFVDPRFATVAHDTVGTRKYAGFVQSFLPKYEAMVRAGNAPANALDVNDPQSMISQAMAPFKRTPAEKMRDATAAMGGINFGGENGNLTGPGKDVLSTEVIDIPAGMSVQDAVKKYGGGKTVRLPDGRTKALPDAR